MRLGHPGMKIYLIYDYIMCILTHTSYNSNLHLDKRSGEFFHVNFDPKRYDYCIPFAMARYKDVRVFTWFMHRRFLFLYQHGPFSVFYVQNVKHLNI